MYTFLEINITMQKYYLPSVYDGFVWNAWPRTQRQRGCDLLLVLGGSRRQSGARTTDVGALGEGAHGTGITISDGR
jgi:hypothetical protein